MEKPEHGPGEAERLRAALETILAETGKDFRTPADTLRSMNQIRAFAIAALEAPIIPPRKD